MTVTTIDGYVYAAGTIPSGVTLSATNNAGTATVTVTAGAFLTTTGLISQLVSDLNSQLPVSGGSWQGAHELAADNGFCTLQVSNGTFSITWIDTNLRDALGFAGNISTTTSSTGTLNARGFWRPDCPIYVEGGRYKAAPRETDLRQTVSPTGYTIGHVGNVRYRHRGVMWSHVPNHKVWIADELTTHESLERFLIDTQWGQGHTWFTPSSKTRITSHDGQSLGASPVLNWWWQEIPSMEAICKRRDEWEGLWTIRVPALVSDGT